MNYLQKHLRILKNSFKVDMTFFKLGLIDLGFVLTLILSYMLIYFFYVKDYLSISNLLSIANNGRTPPSMSGMDMNILWNTFVANSIVIILVTLILYVIILSIYGTISHLCLTNNKFKRNILINFIYIYALFTLIYILLSILIFFMITNIMTAAWIIFVLTIIYLYAMMIFYLVIKDDKIGKIFRHGFKSMIKIHDTIIPIIISIIALSIICFIIVLLFNQFVMFAGILIYLSFIIVLIWFRRYMHVLIHT